MTGYREKGFSTHKRKTKKLKQQSREIIKTLTSAKFKAHVQRTLHKIPEPVYQALISKLIDSAHQGVPEKWFGVAEGPVEARIGYEPDGNCYTIFALKDVYTMCYDLKNNGIGNFVRLSLPNRITVTNF
jgi:hypothetical protein